jgi:hypothetical protein
MNLPTKPNLVRICQGDCARDRVGTYLLVIVIWNIPFRQSCFTLSILCVCKGNGTGASFRRAHLD